MNKLKEAEKERLYENLIYSNLNVCSLQRAIRNDVSHSILFSSLLFCRCVSFVLAAATCSRMRATQFVIILHSNYEHRNVIVVLATATGSPSWVCLFVSAACVLHIERAQWTRHNYDVSAYYTSPFCRGSVVPTGTINDGQRGQRDVE